MDFISTIYVYIPVSIQMSVCHISVSTDCLVSEVNIVITDCFLKAFVS